MGLEYNGTNQYVGCGNDGSLNIIGEITISVWIKHTTSAFGGIVVKRESSGVSDMGYNLRIHNDGTVDFYLRNTSKIGSVIFSNAALNDDVLHYVVGIRDSSNNLIMYVDDVLQNDTDTLTDSLATSADLIIGRYYSELDDYYFNGLIFDARIYNRALSPSEVKTLYESRGSDNIVNGLVGRWLMNEGTDGAVAAGANSVIDISGDGNHGTPVNSPIYRASPMKLLRPMIIG